jgi:hypothetical protein
LALVLNAGLAPHKKLREGTFLQRQESSCRHNVGINILALHGTSNMLPALIVVASFLVGFALGYATRARRSHKRREHYLMCARYM